MPQKDKYCEFIARGVKYAQKENHGVFFPESTIVVVDYLSDLAIMIQFWAGIFSYLLAIAATA